VVGNRFPVCFSFPSAFDIQSCVSLVSISGSFCVVWSELWSLISGRSVVIRVDPSYPWSEIVSGLLFVPFDVRSSTLSVLSGFDIRHSEFRCLWSVVLSTFHIPHSTICLSSRFRPAKNPAKPRFRWQRIPQALGNKWKENPDIVSDPVSI
jgi:hypothetical protein